MTDLCLMTRTPRAAAADQKDPNPTEHGEHGAVLRKNIHAIADLEERALHQRGAADRLSDAISRAMGSGPFELLHVIGFSAWLVLFGSKFVILEALAFAFADKVHFGGPIHGLVILIVVVIVMPLLEVAPCPSPRRITR